LTLIQSRLDRSEKPFEYCQAKYDKLLTFTSSFGLALNILGQEMKITSDTHGIRLSGYPGSRLKRISVDLSPVLYGKWEPDVLNCRIENSYGVIVTIEESRNERS
jgi:hypothetical protein